MTTFEWFVSINSGISSEALSAGYAWTVCVLSDSFS